MGKRQVRAPFQELTLDLVTALPDDVTISGQKRNCILTVVDIATRFAIFIPTYLEVTGAELFEEMQNAVVRYFGRPLRLVSDRDVRFQDKWKKLWNEMGTHIELSNGHESGTAAIAERAHRSIMELLRLMIGTSTGWLQWLPHANALFNNLPNAATGTTPAESVFRIGLTPRVETGVPFYFHLTDEDRIMWETHTMRKSKAKLLEAIRRWTQKADKVRTDHHDLFPENSAAYVHTKILGKNQITSDMDRDNPYLGSKLDGKWRGPVKVVKCIGNRGVEIDVGKGTRMHDVIPVQWLKPSSSKEPLALVNKNTDEYEIAEVVDQKRVKNVKWARIRWKDYTPQEDTWELVDDIDDMPCWNFYENLSEKEKKDLRTNLPRVVQPFKILEDSWTFPNVEFEATIQDYLSQQIQYSPDEQRWPHRSHLTWANRMEEEPSISKSDLDQLTKLLGINWEEVKDKVLMEDQLLSMWKQLIHRPGRKFVEA